MKVTLMFFMLLVLVVSLNGCTTVNGQNLIETQNLKNKVASLEEQLVQKDAEIESLRVALSRTTQEKYTAAKEKQLKDLPLKPSNKQIQTALLNAGYNPGTIDGHMGKLTQKAIKDFQQANNLTVDGKVGKETWAVLGPYLYARTAQ